MNTAQEILQEMLVIDSSGTVIPASTCRLIHKTFVPEDTLSDSEMTDLADLVGIDLSTFIDVFAKERDD